LRTIYEFCNTRKISMKKAAKDIGISQPYLSQIANGVRNPSLKTARKIASAFGITVSELLGETECKHANKIKTDHKK